MSEVNLRAHILQLAKIQWLLYNSTKSVFPNFPLIKTYWF